MGMKMMILTFTKNSYTRATSKHRVVARKDMSDGKCGLGIIGIKRYSSLKM
jgi:hypothetical protein